MLDKIKAAVEARLDETVRFLQEMIRIPSENPPGRYEAIAARVEAELRRAGLTAETIRTPELVLRELGLEPPRLNVVGHLAGTGGGKTLIFNAHLDTVPVSNREAWRCDPFAAEVVDGVIYGRGAADSKARLAGYLAAIRAIRDLGIPLRGDVLYTATADEETGGLAGPGYLVKAGLLRGDYAIVEGRCASVAYAMCGVLHAAVTTTGKAVHARNPEEGVNAIYRMVPLIARLERYHAELRARKTDIPGIPAPTCSVGTIAGGVKTNVIPDRCTITVDRRVVPGEDPAQVWNGLRDVVAAAAGEAGHEAAVEQLLFAEPHLSDPDSVLVRSLVAHATAYRGAPVPVVGSTGFGDARFFCNLLKIPTANYGPGRDGTGAHAVNEHVYIEDLREGATVCAATILDLCR
jgi:succinyl-diaminopimelate desuccinylase